MNRPIALLTGLLVMVAGLASAQTAEQLQMFTKLPPAQQEALLKQFKQGGAGGLLGGGTAGRFQEVSTPVVEMPASPADNSSANSNELQLFGYSLFRAQPTTFAPTTDVPVPSDYVLGPGDTLQLWLFGKEVGDYTLTIDRNGQVFLPEIGPLVVAGLRFSEARATVSEAVSKAKIGVSANLAMGELRAIRVFVAGDARNPGAYTVSALSTMTQALYVSGGVKDIGSLRTIQLRRNGTTVTTLDLYKLLLEGDSSGDARLQSGDVVFVPPLGQTVGVRGAVRRPAIYEVHGRVSVEQAISLAGGLQPGAVVDRITIERVENGRRSLLAGTLRADSDVRSIRSGDVISVYQPRERLDDGIEVIGAADRPGKYALQPGAHFTDIIRSEDDLKPLSDLDFAIILRRSEDGARLDPLYLNPRRAFAGDIDADLVLMSGDQLFLFSAVAEFDGKASSAGSGKLSSGQLRLARSLGLAEKKVERDTEFAAGEPSQSARVAALVQRRQQAQARSSGESAGLEVATDAGARDYEEAIVDAYKHSREQRMASLVAALESTARAGSPAPVVAVVGAVRFPGEVPLDQTKNTVADVLRAVGGRTATAEKGFVEIVRAPVRGQAEVQANRIITRANENSLGSLRIFPGDTIAVRDIPGAVEQRSVRILGEVIYPGTYQVAEGTSLRELVQRAGGLSEKAFAKGAVFTRENLRRKEEEQVARLRERLKGDLAAAALTKAGTSTQAPVGLQALGDLFEQLTTYEALGRLVINIESQLAQRDTPITLDDGDTLIIPKTPEEVTVIGEVQFPTSHRWEPGNRRSFYLERSGGFTSLADGGRTFVVRADGSVESRKGWFGGNPVLEPGDLIVVPFDATPIEPLTAFSAITQVVYQLALSIAAFNSVGAF